MSRRPWEDREASAARGREWLDRRAARLPQQDTPAIGSAVELIDAASLKPEPIRWLWPGWLAQGKLHVLAGAAGTGKTTLALSLAARITAGHALPGGYVPRPGRVLIWSGEDDPRDTLVPRLLAAGADLTRVRFVGEVFTGDDDKRPFDPALDVPALAEAARRWGDVCLVIVDPVVSTVAGDSHKNTEVRRALAPLVELGQRLHAAVLGITHYTKGTNGRDPLERVTGSLAFGALARIVLGIARQRQDDETAPRRYTLARCKSNIGPDGDGYAYGLEPVTLAGIEACRIAWGDAVNGTARDLLTEPDPEPDDDTGQDAAGFLRDLLADGAMPVRDVRRYADEAGHAWRTVQRAMRQAGVESRRNKFGGSTTWQLSSAPSAPLAPDSERGANGANGAEEADFSTIRNEPGPWKTEL